MLQELVLEQQLELVLVLGREQQQVLEQELEQERELEHQRVYPKKILLLLNSYNNLIHYLDLYVQSNLLEVQQLLVLLEELVLVLQILH